MLPGPAAQRHLYGFDPHFKIFHELMPHRVQEILLVSSPYDAYIMEEDVSLATRIINEYLGLNLSHPPRITRVSTADQAFDLLGQRRVDLIVTMPNLGGMDICAFSRKIRHRHVDIPLVLLSHSPQERAGCDALANTIDNAYIWCCDSDLLLAIVKNIEDQENVDNDTAKAMVRVLLLVEDSAEDRSRLLPMLYGELVNQTHKVLGDGLNEQHRLLKMRARPKILTAASYEQALGLFNRYEPYIFAVVSDGRFPQAGRLEAEAGLRLLTAIRQRISDLPLLMLSSESANRAQAEGVPAVFVDKNSRTIRRQIHDFFLSYLGFGDFVFRLSDGTEVARASGLHDFEEALTRVPAASVHYHATRNHFSNWVMARAEVALAARLHRSHFAELGAGEALRGAVVERVHALRKLRQKGVVTQFHRDRFDPDIVEFVRIGKGSMGGKARGLAFMAAELRLASLQHTLPEQSVLAIPRTCVITTSGFAAFIELNGLQRRPDETDPQVVQRFLAAQMPVWLLDDLRVFLAKTSGPLSVRSSSMLEDAQFRPYAGLYCTTMLANAAPKFEARLDQLCRAIKLVYASTWFEGPQAFSRSVGQQPDDAMAVIVQQLVGRRYGQLYYPAMSGLVQSVNYYPLGAMRSEEGIAHLALGLGKTVMDGQRCLRFCPALPEHLPQFSTVGDILANAQQEFYALDLENPWRFSEHDGNLVRRQLTEVASDAPVRLLSSTYIHEEQRIRDADLPGPKVLTFAPILKHGLYPLAPTLSRLIRLGREGMGCEVEIEFAIDLDPRIDRSVFHVLQIRPVVSSGGLHRLRIQARERARAMIRSRQALGHGRIESMVDLVYVRPQSFDRRRTRDLALAIAKLNAGLERQGRPYLLLGPGRWGSGDPWLGIPVQWNAISGVGAMVELQGRQVAAEPSQGSHFFHNLLSLGIPYLVVEEQDAVADGAGDFIDWSRIEQQEVVWADPYLCHVRFARPLLIKVNGTAGEAVILEAEADGA
jgi:CheY-like chemotaxis protein